MNFSFQVFHNIFRAFLIPAEYQKEDQNMTGGDYVISGINAEKLSEDEYRRISQMFQYRRRDR